MSIINNVSGKLRSIKMNWAMQSHVFRCATHLCCGLILPGSC